MSSKTLSTGTLSLRFMQNALRSQQQQVELERAEVKDEGKWEIGQPVKDAWGIGHGTQQHDTVTHESSYLPFLFGSDYDGNGENETSKPLGRRTFDKGHEVSTHQPASQQADGDTKILGEDTSATSPLNTEDQSSTKGGRLKVHAKPISMSSLSVGKTLKGIDSFDKPRITDREKEIHRQKSIAGLKQRSARRAIFDMSGVGTDLRSTRKSKGKGRVNDVMDDDLASSDEDGLKAKQRREKNSQQPAATGFLKPAGVDEPTPHPTLSGSIGNAKHTASPIPDVIDGARKRTRESGDHGDEEKGRKKKKKKKKVAAE